MEERRGERDEPHDDVSRAGRRERQEQRVRGEVVERRAGVDAKRREDLRDIPAGERQREDLVGPERARERRPAPREGAGRDGRPQEGATRKPRAAGRDSHPGFFRAFVSRRRASSASSASRYFVSAGLRRIASS